MAAIRFTMPPIALAAKAESGENGFMDWLDNAFQKKAGLRETSDSECWTCVAFSCVQVVAGC